MQRLQTFIAPSLSYRLTECFLEVSVAHAQLECCCGEWKAKVKHLILAHRLILLFLLIIR